VFDSQLPYNPSPIKTKKITVISDVEADEVPVTGAKREIGSFLDKA